MPTGGGEQETVIDQQTNPTSLISDGDAVYWANWSLAGWIATLQPPVDEPGQHDYRRIYAPATLPHSLVADGDELYWVQESAQRTPDLVRFDLSAGPSTPTELILRDIAIPLRSFRTDPGVASLHGYSAVAIDSEALYALKSRSELRDGESFPVTDIHRVVR